MSFCRWTNLAPRNRRARYIVRASAASCLALTIGIAEASAQTLPEAQPNPNEATDQGSLGEIIVTATKRSTRLQDTPAAITALDADAIAERGITGTADLQSSVPNLNFGEVLGNPTVSIRGVGLPIVTGDSQQGVASYLNGVYLTTPSIAAVALNDLQSVEVLRGPQGTLYGRNATGGAVSYTTTAPSFDFGLGGSVGYGNYDTFSAKGYLTGPIVDDVVAFRLFASRRSQDGYVRNLITGNRADAINSTSVKGDLLIQAAANLRIDLTALYSRDTGSFSGNEILNTNVVGIAVLPASIGAPPPTLGVNYVLGQRQLLASTDDTSRRETQAYIGRIGWDVGSGVTLKSITGYLIQDRFFIAPGLATVPSAAFPLDFLNGKDERDRTFSQEFNLSANLGRFDALAGLYYARQKNDGFIRNDIYTTNPAFFPPGTPPQFTTAVGPYYLLNQFPLNRTSKVTVKAAFADATFRASDRFRIYGGMRVSSDKITTNFVNPIPPCNQPGGFDVEREDTSFSPRAGVQFDVRQDQMLYAQYQRGYKAGGFSQVACNNEYKPEKLTSYEVGYRSQWLDRRLTVNMTGFYYDYKDYQLFQITPMLSAVILNVPEVTSYGAELEISARPSRFFSLDGSVGYLHARYGRFLQADTFSFGPAAPIEDLKGRQIVQAPDWTGHLGAEFTIPADIGPFDEIRLRGELYATSSYSLRRFNRPFDVQDGYVTQNAYLTLAGPDNRYSLRLFVRNISDKRFAVGEVDNVNTGLIQGQWSPPRTFGFELGVKFK